MQTPFQLQAVAVRQIGCIILSGAVFFPENLWVRQPDDWGWQNMRYKAYVLTSGEGLRIWRECQERSGAIELGGAAEIAEDHGVDRFGKPVLVRLSHSPCDYPRSIVKPGHAIQRLREVLRRQHKALSTETNLRPVAAPVHSCLP